MHIVPIIHERCVFVHCFLELLKLLSLLQFSSLINSNVLAHNKQTGSVFVNILSMLSDTFEQHQSAWGMMSRYT